MILGIIWTVCVAMSYGYVEAQFTGCDYLQNMEVGKSYDVFSPKYSNSYPANTNCRWTAKAPTGYVIQINCVDINMPLPSTSNGLCVNDKLQISYSGQASLGDAQTYCGKTTFASETISNQIVIALRVPSVTSGGRFRCTITTRQIQASCDCGRRKTSRIVGGTNAAVNEFPMVAGLVDKSVGAVVYCGATIISNYYALSSAHSVIGRNINNLGLLVGDHDYNTGSDTQYAALYQLSTFYIYPNYNSNNNQDDISLVRTLQSITFNVAVGPVCLPFKFTSSTFENSRVEAAGWGTTSFGGPQSSTLQKVTLSVISNAQCSSSYPSQISNTQLCTYTANKDTCQSDSGGSLLYTDPTNGLLYDIGIISYGKACATNYPGVCTRVTSYLSWIEQTVGSSSLCRK